jgi:hypothetical protein
MGYPPQPQDPYGQSGPQQPYGQSGPQQPYRHIGPQPQPYGYGYQPPTSPPPPPQRNLGLILALAIGIPLLLLGGCAAVVLVLADTGARTARETLVTEADEPNAVMPSQQPIESVPPAEESSAPSAVEPKNDEPATAAVGGTITLQGMDPGLKVKVTVTKLVNPATPAQDFMKPKAGNRFVAVEVTLENVGEAVYSDAPTNSGILIDGEGQQYRSTFSDVREGQGFGGTATINKGDSRKGVIVFEVPEGAKLAKFQFGLNSGFAQQKGEWTLN